MKNTNQRQGKQFESQKSNLPPRELSEEQMSKIDMDLKDNAISSEASDTQDTDRATGENNQAEDSADLKASGHEAPEQTQSQSQSLGNLISGSLAKESQATIDSTIAKVTESVKEAKQYMSEKPVEAALIACSAALASWVLLGTKPGRKVFDLAAARFVPEMTSWASKTFKASLQ